jgi:Ion channel
MPGAFPARPLATGLAKARASETSVAEQRAVYRLSTESPALRSPHARPSNLRPGYRATSRRRTAGCCRESIGVASASDRQGVSRWSWRPGSRAARLHASHSYRFVLFLVLTTSVFVMATPDETWALSAIALLLCSSLIVAIWTSGLGWSLARTLFLIGIGVAIAVVVQTTSGDVTTGVVWFVGLVLAAAIAGVIAVGVIDQGEVNNQSVVGAISIYLLLGLFFSFAYSSAAKLGSGFFFAQGTDGTAAIRLYFSYITMATVGYGDYTAAGDFGRTLAIFEGLIGQLYLVTVIALLVGRMEFRRPESSA